MEPSQCRTVPLAIDQSDDIFFRQNISELTFLTYINTYIKIFYKMNHIKEAMSFLRINGYAVIPKFISQEKCRIAID